MALIDCTTCGRPVAPAAKVCPHCGQAHPSTPPPGAATKLIAGVLTVALVVVLPIWGVNSCFKAADARSVPATDDTAQWQDELARQPERLHLIDRLIDQGVFRRVQFLPEHDPVGGATVWVDAVFDGLSYDQKKTFVDVVYAVAAVRSRRENVIVELRDHHSNHKVGQRTLFGLKVDR